MKLSLPTNRPIINNPSVIINNIHSPSPKSLAKHTPTPKHANISWQGHVLIDPKSCAFCFDVDSTVIQEEGIDLLAIYSHIEDQVAQLTNQAMGGQMSFRESLRARLDLIQPSRDLIENFLDDQDKIHLSPNIVELIEFLRRAGVEIFLISGGLRLIVERIADQLGIPRSNVFANTIFFDDQGEYCGFDEEFPTANTHGKGKVIDYLRREKDFSKIVMIGDGITDLETKPHADLFIGYGGIVQRDPVKRSADWFVTDFRQILNEIRKDLNDGEIDGGVVGEDKPVLKKKNGWNGGL